MKFINILISLIICLPIANALYAGNQENITLDVSPSSCAVIDNESNPLTDYNTDGLNFTIEGTKVIINTHPALMPGDYTLVCNYTDTEETQESTGGGGGGSGGGTYTQWICGNWSECIDNKTTSECYSKTNSNVKYTQTKSCTVETNETETKQPEVKDEPETPEEDKGTRFVTNDINITEKIDMIERNLNESNAEPQEEVSGLGFMIVLFTVIIGVGGYIIYKRKLNSDS